jgi:hypothetical protein
MSFTAGLYLGKECSIGSGCLIKFDPSKPADKLESNTQYLLLSGGAYVSYDDEIEQLMLSPYNSKWSSYHDPWNYEKICKIKVISTTVFASIGPIDTSKHRSSAVTFDNSTVHKTMAANSTLYVIGTDYTVDNEEYSNQRMRLIIASESREIKISTNKTCSLIYIEPV